MRPDPVHHFDFHAHQLSGVNLQSLNETLPLIVVGKSNNENQHHSEL